VRSQGEMRNSANHSNRRDFNVIQNRKTSNPKSNQATRNAYGKKHSTATNPEQHPQRKIAQLKQRAQSSQGKHSSKSKYENKKSFSAQQNRDAKIRKDRQKHGTRAKEK
jgi:hypothetical protein